IKGGVSGRLTTRYFKSYPEKQISAGRGGLPYARGRTGVSPVYVMLEARRAVPTSPG
ncbi:unnamed protein product, partial [marine sediment metagenome]